MQNLTTVNIVKRQAQLYKPIHYFSFGKLFILGFFLPNMECQVSMLAILHYNDEDSFFDERVFIRHNIWMIKLSQQFGLDDYYIRIFVMDLPQDVHPLTLFP